MYGKAGHPVFSNVNMGAPHDDMKHLEFLRAYGNYYCNKVAYAYTSSCSLLPSSCRSGLRNLETKVTTMSAPFLNGLQQSSERVLWNLDSKVCGTLQSLLTGSPTRSCYIVVVKLNLRLIVSLFLRAWKAFYTV